MQPENFLLLGNSKKFYELIKKISPYSNIQIVSWRNCNKFYEKNSLNENIKPDWIIVCGYDYGGSSQNFHEFYRSNILEPYKLISRAALRETRVVYISTAKSENKNPTYSRYSFAKSRLGYKLSRSHELFFSFNLPTIIDNAGGLQIYGGRIHEAFFTIFTGLKLLKTVKLNEIEGGFQEILLKPFVPAKFGPYKKPRLLSIRRSLFFDRLLRLVNG